LCRSKSTRGRHLPNVFPVLTFHWFPGRSMNSAPLSTEVVSLHDGCDNPVDRNESQAQ
jgi:hypothetical protein